MLSTAVCIAIDWYQSKISRWFPPRCRFYPTCSEYSKQCFQKYGFAIAGRKTITRLLRCQPYFQGGIDLP